MKTIVIMARGLPASQVIAAVLKNYNCTPARQATHGGGWFSFTLSSEVATAHKLRTVIGLWLDHARYTVSERESTQ